METGDLPDSVKKAITLIDRLCSVFHNILYNPDIL